MKNSKFSNFAGGSHGRAPNSAQLYTVHLIDNRFQNRASTGGKEMTDRTRKIKSGILTRFRPAQSLVVLLVFIATATIITAGATTVALINSQSGSKFSLAQETLAVAEAGADNAILRFLRNPSYTGETLTVGDGTATITVSGSSTKTIDSTGQVGSIIRKIRVVGNYTGNTFTITSWTQID